ncbi:thiamine-phosphate kinase [Bacillus salitolerans]|uniref:Thiamine-monophosphate kinase n=1 Tax=Bacillus salitolerans TaxID=1437434 RepID=A0ABW4LST0_9BACI
MGIHDEFSFIKAITPKEKRREDVIVSIGDDAAIFRTEKNSDTIACTDTMVEDIHFKQETMEPFHIGFKALAANISDVAAMGGIPQYYLVSIAIPEKWSEESLMEIYKGMEHLAEKYNMDLIGGDTVSTFGPLVLNVTVIGSVENDRGIKRSSAKPGDVVFITGNIGDSAAGLHILLNEKANKNQLSPLVLKHQMPLPNVQAGQLLVKQDRVSLNDISDGAASEAIEIAEASHVDIILYKSQLPFSNDILTFGFDRALNWGLFGGEDYELIGTISQNSWEKVMAEFAKIKIKITKVGEVVEGSGKVFLQSEKRREQLLKQGYNHFGTR